jgi:hypothetical protein
VHLFHGVAGKYGLDAPVELTAAVRTFDRILFPNADRLDRYLAAGLISGGSGVAVLTGYPKVDCLVDGSLDRQEIGARLRLDPGRRTVIYAPTWSEHSSLHTTGERVIAALADAGLNVIVKLHACSYSARGAAGVDWRARLLPLASRPNVLVVDDADASPYMVGRPLVTVTARSASGHGADRRSSAHSRRSSSRHDQSAKVALLKGARVVHDVQPRKRRAVGARYPNGFQRCVDGWLKSCSTDMAERLSRRRVIYELPGCRRLPRRPGSVTA